MQVNHRVVAVWIDSGRIELLYFIANREDKICCVEAQILIVAPHEADRTNDVRMIVGDGAFAMKGNGYREPARLRETTQGLRRVAAYHAVARQNDRIGGFADHLRSCFETNAIDMADGPHCGFERRPRVVRVRIDTMRMIFMLDPVNCHTTFVLEFNWFYRVKIGFSSSIYAPR